MVGKGKNRRRTADGLKSFLLHLQFLSKFDKTARLQGNKQKNICGYADKKRRTLNNNLVSSSFSFQMNYNTGEWKRIKKYRRLEDVLQ
jgi:hypothetical protein